MDERSAQFNSRIFLIVGGVSLAIFIIALIIYGIAVGNLKDSYISENPLHKYFYISIGLMALIGLALTFFIIAYFTKGRTQLEKCNITRKYLAENNDILKQTIAKSSDTPRISIPDLAIKSSEIEPEVTDDKSEEIEPEVTDDKSEENDGSESSSESEASSNLDDLMAFLQTLNPSGPSAGPSGPSGSFVASGTSTPATRSRAGSLQLKVSDSS
jgi:hypothetical protein